jgi:hypothetical protein
MKPADSAIKRRGFKWRCVDSSDGARRTVKPAHDEPSVQSPLRRAASAPFDASTASRKILSLSQARDPYGDQGCYALVPPS